MLYYDKLQEEIYKWKIRNFGGKKKNGHENLLGVIEEVGELAHGILKKQQGIRMIGNFDLVIKDAIGDIFIFLMNYLSEMNIKFEMKKIFFDQSVCDERDEINVFDIHRAVNEIVILHRTIETYNCTNLSASILKNSQILVERLMFLCVCNNWNFEKIIFETWEQVKQRDWTKNKINGVDE